MAAGLPLSHSDIPRDRADRMLMLSAFPRVARAQQRDTLQGHFDPIDEADLIDLLLGFDLVQEQLSASTIEKTRQLGRRLATGYLGTRLVGDPSTGLNNWQSHRIKLATAGAYLAGDTELIAGARKGFMEQVSRNIDTDGRTDDFGQRDAMHYVVYDLEPLLMAASIAAAHGEDWYSAL